MDTKMLYIMVSKTDTGIGRIIRSFTGYPYNHVSLTLDPTFRTWVSFARYVQDTPLYGGFIQEPVERFLAKGEQIDVRIYGLAIPEPRYSQLQTLFALAGKQEQSLLYNHFALVSAACGIDVPIAGAYTCLGFANAVLRTDHKNIQALDAQLSPALVYDGSLGALAPDSGRRDDLYFTRLGPLHGSIRSITALATLFYFLLNPQRTDLVKSVLSATPTQK